MQWLTFIASFTFCSLFLCLCDGAPPKASGSYRGTSRGYCSEEESFLIEEMRRYPSKVLPIWGTEMWIKIAERHRKMHESNPSTFPPRTDIGLRTHFQRIMLTSKGKVPLPKDLMERIPKPQQKKRASADDPGSTSSLQNEQGGVTGSAPVRRDAQAHDIKKTRNKYTPQEHKFIFNFLKNYPRDQRPAYDKKIWNEAAEELKSLRKQNPSHFPHERTGKALQSYFQRAVKKLLNKRKKNIPDADQKNLRYTHAEDDFIIKELLKPTCTSLYSASCWKKIKAGHDKKVQSKSSGFDQYRSVSSLESRFIKVLLKEENQLPQALKDKFPRISSRTQGETSNTQEAGNEEFDLLEDSNENFNIWEAGNEEFDLLEDSNENFNVWEFLDENYADLQEQFTFLDEDFADLEDTFECEGNESEVRDGDSGRWADMIEELLNKPDDRTPPEKNLGNDDSPLKSPQRSSEGGTNKQL